MKNLNEGIVQIKVQGEIWNAQSYEKLEPGDKVQVTFKESNKLMLTIKKLL